MGRSTITFTAGLLAIGLLALSGCKTYGGSALVELDGLPAEAFRDAQLFETDSEQVTIEWVDDVTHPWFTFVTADKNDGEHLVRASRSPSEDDDDESCLFELRIEEVDSTGRTPASLTFEWIGAFDRPSDDAESEDYAPPSLGFEVPSADCTVTMGAGGLSGTADCLVREIEVNGEPVQVEIPIWIEWKGAGAPARRYLTG